MSKDKGQNEDGIVADEVNVEDLGEVDIGQAIPVESDRVAYMPGAAGTMTEHTQEKFIDLCGQMLEKGRIAATGYLVALNKHNTGQQLSKQDEMLLNNDQLKMETADGRPIMVKLRRGPGGMGKSSLVTTGVNLSIVSEGEKAEPTKIARTLGFIISVGTPMPVRPILAGTARQTWPKSALTSQMHDSAVQAILAMSAAGIPAEEYTDL